MSKKSRPAQRPSTARSARAAKAPVEPAAAPPAAAPSTAPGRGPQPRPRRYRVPTWACGEVCGAAFGVYFGLTLLGLLLAVAPPSPGAADGARAGGLLAGLLSIRRPAPVATPAPRPAPVQPGLPPREAVLAAEAARLAQPAWVVKETVSTDEASYVQTLSFEAPDRYRLDQPGIAEIITIGQWAWVRDGPTWSLGQTGAQAVTAAAAQVQRTGLLDEALAAGVRFEARPAEIVAGAPAHAYTWSVPSPLGAGSSPTVATLWVRQADSLPLRLRVEGSFAGRKQVTQLDYEYPPDLAIEPPPAPTPGPTSTAARPVTE
jgi:hypothetical protein